MKLWSTSKNTGSWVSCGKVSSLPQLNKPIIFMMFEECTFTFTIGEEG